VKASYKEKPFAKNNYVHWDPNLTFRLAILDIGLFLEINVKIKINV